MTATVQALYAKPLEAIGRVLDQDGGGITIARTLAAGEPFFAGHYPGFPIFPGVFVIEAVHQAVRHALAAGGGAGVLEEIRSARFVAPVRPGDDLVCRCVFTWSADGVRLEVKAACSVDGAPAAEVKLAYRVEGRRA